MQFIDLAEQQRLLRPQIDAAIAAVLDHGRYIMGPEVAELEAKLADFCGAAHVVSCASGTDAITMALLARGVGAGDAVFVPSFTFAATAEAVALLGASPVFVDIDEDSFNIDADSVRAAVDGLAPELRAVGIIAVDLFGMPADYAALSSVAAQHDMWVLADAAQSFGGHRDGVPVGQLAEVTTTSFFPAKPLGCYGDGGAVITSDAELASVLRSIRVHGSGSEKYDNVRLGINGRLDTLQAAILLQKLTVFDSELAARDAVARRYGQLLGDAVTTPSVPDGSRSAWAQYTLRVPGRDEFIGHLRDAGVPTAVYYPRPLHLQTAYRSAPQGSGGLAVSERLAGEVVSLPMHPYLSESDQDEVVAAVLAATRPG